jgi:hypothetical protein
MQRRSNALEPLAAGQRARSRRYNHPFFLKPTDRGRDRIGASARSPSYPPNHRLGGEKGLRKKPLRAPGLVIAPENRPRPKNHQTRTSALGGPSLPARRRRALLTVGGFRPITRGFLLGPAGSCAASVMRLTEGYVLLERKPSVSPQLSFEPSGAVSSDNAGEEEGAAGGGGRPAIGGLPFCSHPSSIEG